MNTRNYYILVASICVGITVFWLSAYNIARLGIDPIEYIEKNVSNINEEDIDEEEKILTIRGDVEEELKLSLSEIKSDKYVQKEDLPFYFRNTGDYGSDDHDGWRTVSGVTLWSILKEEDLLEGDSSDFEFVFIGKDGYQSKPLDLSLAESNPNKVLIAYEIDDEPLEHDYKYGPIRAVVHEDLVPEGENGPYWVYKLAYVDVS